MHVNRPLRWLRFSRSNVAIMVVPSSRLPNEAISSGRLALRTTFSDLESAVNLYVPPLEFVANAEIILDVDRALAILSEIGFEDLPVRIRDKESLQGCIIADVRGWTAIERRTTSTVRLTDA